MSFDSRESLYGGGGKGGVHIPMENLFSSSTFYASIIFFFNS